MATNSHAVVVQRCGFDPLHVLVRLVMVIYLSPALLAFLAIGLVGVVVARLGVTPRQFALEDDRPCDEGLEPAGSPGSPVRACQVA